MQLSLHCALRKVMVVSFYVSRRQHNTQYLHNAREAHKRFEDTKWAPWAWRQVAR